MDYFFSLIYSIFILFSLFLFNITYNYSSVQNNILNQIQNELNDYHDNNNYYKYNKNKRLLSSIPKDLMNQSLINSSYLNHFHKKKFINMWNTQLKEKFFDGEVNYTNISSKITNHGNMNLRIFFPKEEKIWEDVNPTFKIRIFENKTVDKWMFISKNIKVKKLFDVYEEVKEVKLK